MFVPKLGEEEARYFVLLYLAQSPKRQGSVEDIRDFIRTERGAFGDEDTRPNPTRSNAPFWYQIVQNATDRFLLSRGYVTEVEPPPRKKLKLTDRGGDCIRPYLEHFQRHPNIRTFTFFDNELLSDLYDEHAKKMKEWGFLRKGFFIDFMKFASFAAGRFPKLEEQKFAESILSSLEARYRSLEGNDEQIFRLSQISGWRDGRGTFADYDIMRGTLS